VKGIMSSCVCGKSLILTVPFLVNWDIADFTKVVVKIELYQKGLT